MRRIAATLTLTALVLAGCGGDDDEPDATARGSDPTTTSAAAPGSDAPTSDGGGCPFVTAADLSDAFGLSIEEFTASELGCQFSSDDDETLAVVVVPIDIQIDPETYAEESTESCDEGTLVEVDAGDYAYACQAIGPSASVFEGDRLVNLSVLTTDDEQAVLDAFVEVLPSVVVGG
jgi:hypothetical protein